MTMKVSMREVRDGIDEAVGRAFRGGPLVAPAITLLATPVGLMSVAWFVEGRRMRFRDYNYAVTLGDPGLALAALAGWWAMRVSESAVVPPGWTTASLALGMAAGARQMVGESRQEYYSRSQFFSPSKLFHQFAVFPVLGTMMGSSAALCVRAWPVSPGPAVLWAFSAAWWLWLLKVDAGHLRLSHNPFSWRQLRTEPEPWADTSLTLRAHALLREEDERVRRDGGRLSLRAIHAFTRRENQK